MFYVPFVSQNTVFLYAKQPHVRIEQQRVTTCKNTAIQSSNMSKYSNTKQQHFRIQQRKATCQNTATQGNMSEYSSTKQQHVKIHQHKATTCQNTVTKSNNMSKYSNTKQHVRIQQHKTTTCPNTATMSEYSNTIKAAPCLLPWKKSQDEVQGVP